MELKETNINTIEQHSEKKEKANEIKIESNNYTENYVIKLKVDEFIKKIENKEVIKFEDFHLYQKIKVNNQISPLMIFILEKAIEKYNNHLIDNGIEEVGFEKFPGLTDKRRANDEEYFNSEEAYVLYASFPEKFIGNFWRNHQLLSDLLGINPDKTILRENLKLADDTKSISSQTVSSNKKKEKNKKSKKTDSNNSASSQNNDEKINEIDEINNREYYKLSLGANFEYNALHFLLYGIKKFTNFPRIVFFPIVKYIDYEEIDSAILIEEMRSDLEAYYQNFKSIDLNDYKGKRKEFNLQKNDLVFIETSFDIDTKKDKILNFMIKICRFIALYENIGLIKNLDEYTIKPLILYNNNYYLQKENIDDINDSITKLKKIIKKLKNNKKLEEIYENLQLIYCWPTMPLFNNFTTDTELNKKIEEKEDEFKQILNQKLEEKENEFNKKYEESLKEIKYLKDIIFNSKNYTSYHNKNNNYYRYKKYNNSNYHRKSNNYNYKSINYQKYSNYERHYNYKYINNVNKSYYINNNNYKYNNEYYY
jgi:hypothetical protein